MMASRIDNESPSSSDTDPFRPADDETLLSHEDEPPDDRFRHTSLVSVREDAAAMWNTIHPAWRLDKEFVLAALRSPRLPPKGSFERCFPQSLRFDRDVVLAFCKRPDFVQLYNERCLFVPDCLTGDKEVMMAYCRQIPRSLQECSEELCDDPDVVRAAIHLNALDIQYASVRLLHDPELARIACQKDGRALEFCCSRAVRESLSSDRDFMLSVVRQHGGSMLRLVAEPLKRDRALSLEAIKHGMPFRQCAFDLQTDRQFLMDAIGFKASLYLDVPESTQKDIVMAKNAVFADSASEPVFRAVLGHHPHLVRDRRVAEAIASRCTKPYVMAVLLNNDVDYSNDKQVMLNALRSNQSLYIYVSDSLKRDADIVVAALDGATAVQVLASLGSAYLIQNPQVATRVVEVAPKPDLMRSVAPHIPDEVWVDRDHVIAWIRRGTIPSSRLQSFLTSDEGVALEVAEHMPYAFSTVGSSLRADVNFMRKAIDRNGLVIRFCNLTLKRNLDLCVRAIANNHESIPWSLSRGRSYLSRTQLQDHVQEKLDLHRAFMTEFLRGIAIATPHLPPSRRSHLSLLDRGTETSEAFKRSIAEFLGVPLGNDLRRLRKCQENLQRPQSESHLGSSEPDHDGLVQRHRRMRLRHEVFIRRNQRHHHHHRLVRDHRVPEPMLPGFFDPDAAPFDPDVDQDGRILADEPGFFLGVGAGIFGEPDPLDWMVDDIDEEGDDIGNEDDEDGDDIDNEEDVNDDEGHDVVVLAP